LNKGAQRVVSALLSGADEPLVFMNKTQIIIGITVVVLILFTFGYYIRNPLIPKIKIGDTILYLELAITAKKKEIGLGGRDSLQDGWGMLFPYDHKESYQFWMKGMKFPLDFVWIADKKVVDISENIPLLTGSEITTVKPKVPVDQILELNAGDVKKYNINIGDPVVIITK